MGADVKKQKNRKNADTIAVPCGELRGIAGICGKFTESGGEFTELAGLCGTLWEIAENAGHCGTGENCGNATFFLKIHIFSHQPP